MFVGMDLHKNYLQIAVMNEKGKVLENSRIKNNLKQVGRFFDENINDEKAHVVMESSSVWYNIYSYLSEEKHLNPVKTRAIASAGIKTGCCKTGCCKTDLLTLEISLIQFQRIDRYDIDAL